MERANMEGVTCSPSLQAPAVGYASLAWLLSEAQGPWGLAAIIWWLGGDTAWGRVGCDFSFRAVGPACQSLLADFWPERQPSLTWACLPCGPLRPGALLLPRAMLMLELISRGGTGRRQASLPPWRPRPPARTMAATTIACSGWGVLDPRPTTLLLCREASLSPAM